MNKVPPTLDQSILVLIDQIIEEQNQNQKNHGIYNTVVKFLQTFQSHEAKDKVQLLGKDAYTKLKITNNNNTALQSTQHNYILHNSYY